MTVDQKLHLVQTGGANFAYLNPFFSHDGKFLLCPSGVEIKVFSTTTAECTQRLISDDGIITGITQHPNNKLQMISCTSRGVLTIWDYEDGIRLRSYKCAAPSVGVFCEPNIGTHIFIISTSGNNEVLTRLSLQAFRQGHKAEGEDMEEVASNVLGKLPKAVGFLLSGKYIVFAKKRKMCVVSCEQIACSIEHSASADGKVTCFACHPSEDCLATGHESGKIKFWYNVCPSSGSTKQALVVSTLHWHSNILKDLAFTPGGSSLLSVGTESVLVQWHYKEDTSRKSFLPRLGAPLCHVSVSPDGTLIASTHNDNSVSIITSYFTVKHTIRGLTSYVSSKGDPQSNKIFTYDPKLRACVTTGKVGHLIFYDPIWDRELYSLDITHENYISPDRERELPRSTITCVAFPEVENSKAAYWMATTEVVQTKPAIHEIKLKFWEFDETGQRWKLNTVVNDPHKQYVSQICFRPYSNNDGESYCLISTGLDGMVKSWGLIKTINSTFWSCLATTSYREQPARFCDFSQDGSIAAVAFDDTVCTYDPESLSDCSVLLTLTKKTNIQSILFGRHACQHMIIVALQSRLQAYDLLGGYLAWIVDMNACQLARDPLSDFMAALSADSNDLFIFRPTCAVPVYAHKNITSQEVSCLQFLPHESLQPDDCAAVPWMIHSRLYVVDNAKALFALCSEYEREGRLDLVGKSKRTSDTHSLKTPMAYILDGISKVTDVPKTKDNMSNTNRRTQFSAVNNITSVSSHVLPSMSTLCMEFLDSFLLKKNDKGVVSANLDVEMSQLGTAKENHLITLSNDSLQTMMDTVNIERIIVGTGSKSDFLKDL